MRTFWQALMKHAHWLLQTYCPQRGGRHIPPSGKAKKNFQIVIDAGKKAEVDSAIGRWRESRPGSIKGDAFESAIPDILRMLAAFGDPSMAGDVGSISDGENISELDYLTASELKEANDWIKSGEAQAMPQRDRLRYVHDTWMKDWDAAVNAHNARCDGNTSIWDRYTYLEHPAVTHQETRTAHTCSMCVETK